MDFRESKYTKQDQTKEMLSDKPSFLFLLLLFLLSLLLFTQRNIVSTLFKQCRLAHEHVVANMTQGDTRCDSK